MKFIFAALLPTLFVSCSHGFDSSKSKRSTASLFDFSCEMRDDSGAHVINVFGGGGGGEPLSELSIEIDGQVYDLPSEKIKSWWHLPEKVLNLNYANMINIKSQFDQTIYDHSEPLERLYKGTIELNLDSGFEDLELPAIEGKHAVVCNDLAYIILLRV